MKEMEKWGYNPSVDRDPDQYHLVESEEFRQGEMSERYKQVFDSLDFVEEFSTVAYYQLWDEFCKKLKIDPLQDTEKVTQMRQFYAKNIYDKYRDVINKKYFREYQDKFISNSKLGDTITRHIKGERKPENYDQALLMTEPPKTDKIKKTRDYSKVETFTNITSKAAEKKEDEE